MAYEIGDDVVLTVKFRKRTDKTLVDPTVWQVRSRPPADADSPIDEETVVFGAPAGVFTTLASVSTGEFTITLSTDRANKNHVGRWVVWVTLTGAAGKGSRSYHVVVDPEALPV